MGSPQCLGTWASPSLVTCSSVPHSRHTKNTSRSATSSGSAGRSSSGSRLTETARIITIPNERMPRNRRTATRIRSTSSVNHRPISVEAFDDGGVGHAAALAHRLQPVPTAAALQLVEHRGHELRAGGAERVPYGDGASVRVHVFLEPPVVDAELLLPRQHHRGERLVDLHHV